MATFEFTLRGDQIGQFSSLSGEGNNADRVVTLNDVTALGSSSESFTVRVEQVNSGTTEFANGQFVTILDSSGNVVMQRTGIQPDAEQGLGAGDEHLIIGGSNVLIDLAGVNPGPETIQFIRDDDVANRSLGDNDGELDFADLSKTFPCFDRGTMIRTPEGDRRIETLRDGDFVLTRDAGPQPIVWTRSRIVRFQSREDSDLPILFPAGSVASGQPKQDLILSPQHCLVRPDITRAECLLPAKGMTGGQIRVLRGRKSVEYFTLLLPDHQAIWANGCLCESTYPGDYILRSISSVHRAEILARFPLLCLGAAIGYGQRFRAVKTVQQTRKMMRALRQTDRLPHAVG